jgi:hypothetical protein
MGRFDIRGRIHERSRPTRTFNHRRGLCGVETEMILIIFCVVVGMNIGALISRLGWLDELWEELGKLPWEK